MHSLTLRPFLSSAVKTNFLRASFFRPTFYSTSAAAASTEEVKSPSHGSYHWNAERALSVITLPLMGTAAIYGTIPAVDIALGIVLPLHIHLGFDCIIQDYIPARRTKVLNTLCTWLLRIGTVLTLFGCYVINSRDVGLTALTARLWTGKSAPKSTPAAK